MQNIKIFLDITPPDTQPRSGKAVQREKVVLSEDGCASHLFQLQAKYKKFGRAVTETPHLAADRKVLCEIRRKRNKEGKIHQYRTSNPLPLPFPTSERH
jgi:hypothetical protein